MRIAFQHTAAARPGAYSGSLNPVPVAHGMVVAGARA